MIDIMQKRFDRCFQLVAYIQTMLMPYVYGLFTSFCALPQFKGSEVMASVWWLA
jgi:hypothetical protein